MSAPDFYQLVTDSLRPINRREEDTCREIADHLHEQYEDRTENGEDVQLAAQNVLLQMQNSSRLRRRIRRAQRGIMRDIFRKVLLPGVVSAVPLGFYGLVLEQYFGFRSPAYHFWGAAAFVFYWYMLPAFLVAGALGAWCSRAQGGSRRNRIVSGAFLAILNFVMFTLPFPLALVVDRQTRVWPMMQVYAGYMLSQVIVPGIPMLMGTLPFLFSSPKEINEESTAAPA